MADFDCDSERSYDSEFDYDLDIDVGSGDTTSELKCLRQAVNWDIEEDRSKLFYYFNYLTLEWAESYFPVRRIVNFRDIFRPEEIDWLLSKAAKKLKNCEGDEFIKFVAEMGYKDEPKLDQDGKPLLHRSTPLHHLANCYNYSSTSDLFEIYDRFDVNYTDERGLTHFHVACMFDVNDVVEKFLELGQDPNCLVTETGNSPLHLAVDRGHSKVVEVLLRRGANPNLTNKDGLTPLHLLCTSYDDTLTNRIMELLFKICDEKHQSLQVDTVDNLGRTPLQLAVANFNHVKIDTLLDHGTDLSGLVFPTESHFAENKKLFQREEKSRLVSRILNTVQRLEKRGYELDRRDRLVLMKIFAEFNLFNESKDVDRFFQRLALEFFIELTCQWLPILCCEKIISKLKNEDLFHICLATTDKATS